jgi:hypothetical protein
MWAIWFGLWWLQSIPWGLVGWYDGSLEARAVGAGGVVAGPILYVLNGRADLGALFALMLTLHAGSFSSTSWCGSCSRESGLQKVRAPNTTHTNVSSRPVTYMVTDMAETHLRGLLTKQRKQVDEIKKITNFDTTRKLLEQYDAMNIPPQGPRQQQGAVQGRPGQPGSSPMTPQRGGSSPTSPHTPATPGPPGTPSPTSPRTPGREWRNETLTQRDADFASNTP